MYDLFFMILVGERWRSPDNGAISAVRCRRWLGSLEVRFNRHIHIHWQLLMGMSILKKTLMVACFYRENILYPSSFSFLSQEVDAV